MAASDVVWPATCWDRESMTVRVSETNACAPLASVTPIESVVAPSPGSTVPAITPAPVSSVSPAGSAGPLLDHVRSGMPPVAVNCWR